MQLIWSIRSHRQSNTNFLYQIQIECYLWGIREYISNSIVERDTTGLKWITSFLNELYVHGLCEVVTTQRTMVDVKQPTPIRDGKSKAWLVSMHASLVAEEVLI